MPKMQNSQPAPSRKRSNAGNFIKFEKGDNFIMFGSPEYNVYRVHYVKDKGGKLLGVHLCTKQAEIDEDGNVRVDYQYSNSCPLCRKNQEFRNKAFKLGDSKNRTTGYLSNMALADCFGQVQLAYVFEGIKGQGKEVTIVKDGDEIIDFKFKWKEGSGEGKDYVEEDSKLKFLQLSATQYEELRIVLDPKNKEIEWKNKETKDVSFVNFDNFNFFPFLIQKYDAGTGFAKVRMCPIQIDKARIKEFQQFIASLKKGSDIDIYKVYNETTKEDLEKLIEDVLNGDADDEEIEVDKYKHKKIEKKAPVKKVDDEDDDEDDATFDNDDEDDEDAPF